MSPQNSAKIIQAGLLVAGLGACLQLYGIWLFGSGLPMVTGISFTYVAAAISIVSHKGYGAVVGAVMVGGLLEVVLGLTMGTGGVSCHPSSRPSWSLRSDSHCCRWEPRASAAERVPRISAAGRISLWASSHWWHVWRSNCS